MGEMSRPRKRRRPAPDASPVLQGRTVLAGDAALREGEARFRLALAGTATIVATCDRELRYTWIYNPAAPFTADTVLGRRDDELAPAGDVAALMALKAEVLSTGTGLRREISIVVQGERRWYDVVAEPLVEGDQVLGLTTAATDVTERRRAEEERARLLASEQAARAAAERAIQAREVIMGVVSHDLRAPLNSIRMAAELLLALPQEAADRRERWLRVIADTTQRMEHLVRLLLDQRRLDEGVGLTVLPRPLPVEPLLQEALALFHLTSHTQQVELVSDVPAGLPPMHADRDRMLQVLSNLVDNALRHTPPGGRVTVRVRAEAELILCSVQDTGRGIAADDLPSVFEPFWQADPARGGAGLGLPICKAVVEAHGGEIRVYSEPGQGSTFEFSVPAARAAGPDG
jgi:signal transduction histidine kinase